MIRSIVQSVYAHAKKTPEKLCMADGKKEITYEAAWKSIYGFSKKLLDCGLSKHQCVVAECTQDVDFLVTALSVHMAGGIFVPVEKNAATGQILAIIKQTDAGFYIGREKPDADLFFMPSGNACSFSVIDFPDPSNENFPSGEATSEILFSTGTTGKSKGIELSFSNDIALAENVMYGVEMKKENIELIPMPLSHSHGLRRCFANFLNGSSVVVCNGVILIKQFFDLMDKYSVTAIDLSPSILCIIFKLSKDTIGNYKDRLDYIQLGSAPLIEEDKDRLVRLLPKTRLYNFYGTTEAGCSCIMNFAKMPDKYGCIGRPAKNASFIFVDENRKPFEATEDDPGFLASSGAMNMKGYYKDPELTAETMSGGYIYTNDLCYRDEEGLIYYIGRKDDVINCGGIKIAPDEIESVIMKYPSVKDCACIPIPDELKGQAPKIYLCVDPSCSFDSKDFHDFIKKNLDGNKLPKTVEHIEEIPRTYNGKLQRKKLIAMNEKE